MSPTADARDRAARSLVSDPRGRARLLKAMRRHRADQLLDRLAQREESEVDLFADVPLDDDANTGTDPVTHHPDEALAPFRDALRRRIEADEMTAAQSPKCAFPGPTSSTTTPEGK